MQQHTGSAGPWFLSTQGQTSHAPVLLPAQHRSVSLLTPLGCTEVQVVGLSSKLSRLHAALIRCQTTPFGACNVSEMCSTASTWPVASFSHTFWPSFCTQLPWFFSAQHRPRHEFQHCLPSMSAGPLVYPSTPDPTENDGMPGLSYK